MDALVVFAKEPVAGTVKTRLCPPLTPDQAATLYTAFVEDTCEALALQAREGDRKVLYAPGGAGPVLARIASEHGFETAEQEGADLGARMAAAFAAELARGAAGVLLFGSDSPHLPRAHIRLGQELLGSGRAVVIGPAEDGGYWCIGVRGRVPDLFEGIPWSTRDVLAKTMARAREKAIEVALLPASFDVDEGPDLRRLAGELGDGPGEGGRTRAAIAVLRSARPEVFRSDGSP